MKNLVFLSKSFTKTLVREKTIIALIVALPVLLVLAGAASAPDRDLSIQLDNTFIQPLPSATEVSVVLYSITAVVLISSIVSFFLGFNLTHVITRLKQMDYTSFEITLSFILVMVCINVVMSVVIASISLLWVDVQFFGGYVLGLVLTSVIFATLGLILAEIVDTTTLGLYGILTLAVLDTAFLENPIYSRRYNDDWISLMPSHESIQLILRTIYDTGTYWTSNLLFIAFYELTLIFLYFLISKFNIGLKK